MNTVIGNSIKTEDVVRLTPIVEPIARSFARSYPGVDADDILQEIWLGIIERWEYFDGKEDSYVLTAARKFAGDFCKKQLYAYQLHTAQYVYTPKEIRSLFQECFFEQPEWEKMPGREDNRLTVTDSNGVTVALWDLAEAFDSLNERDQSVLIRCYQIREELTKTEMRAVQRAVDKCTEFLNRKVPTAKRTENFDQQHAPNRHPKNAHAQALLSDD